MQARQGLLEPLLPAVPVMAPHTCPRPLLVGAAPQSDWWYYPMSLDAQVMHDLAQGPVVRNYIGAPSGVANSSPAQGSPADSNKSIKRQTIQWEMDQSYKNVCIVLAAARSQRAVKCSIASGELL